MSPPGGLPTQQEFVVEHATCLGCGCTCDDIAVRVRNGRIADAANACALGQEWFGDGSMPVALRVNGTDASLTEALDATEAMLAAAKAPLVFLAPDLSCEAQRAAVALADRLRAVLDTLTSRTAFASILAAQERGRAGATLGEIRNRADVIVFWGVDPGERYPRYWSRYAPGPAGLHAGGRTSRTVISVDVGSSRGPAEADLRISVPAAEEVATLTALAAVVHQRGMLGDGPAWPRARELAEQLTRGRYVVIVVDGEAQDAAAEARDPQRAAMLIQVAQALNGPTRCALSTLRGGGNRPGADAVLTAQTGYPTAVSFSRGFPMYRPYDAAESADAVLILGDVTRIPADVRSTLTRVPVAIIGPRASSQAGAHAAIDTGVAGIHCVGTAMRLDDVPLPLRPSLSGLLDPADVIQALTHRVARRAADGAPGNLPGQGGDLHRSGQKAAGPGGAIPALTSDAGAR